ncbi:SRPBCC family protein [Sphaerisporangium fuscum]|uniref:SRPBCC family protein n=1 Tax=Sphaerisporangium fuscum TaxID=2835868 RepID=UPI001BDBDC1D|nr:SRPBCC domain-containing protein [Sphaerisporangium fuscum]
MTSAPTTFSAVRRERTFSAPPHTVYRAWLDPGTLRRWLAPGSLELARAEVDERVGGRYRIWQTEGDQPVRGFEAELLELVPDERIVFRWAFVGPDRDEAPAFDSLLTVTFEEAPGGGTHLVLLHERLDALAAAMPEVARQVGGGWDNCLDQLSTAVKA